MGREQANAGKAIIGVLWDVGGVIMDVEPAWGAAAWRRLTGLPELSFSEVVLSPPIKLEMELGRIGPDEALARLGATVQRNISMTRFREALGAMLRFRPAVLDAIGRIRPTIRQAIITNICPIHMSLVRDEPALARAMHSWTTSYEVGAMKPDPRPFTVALERLELDPGRVLYFDDRPDNLATAASLGLKTVLVHGESDVLTGLAAHGLLPEVGR